METTITGHSASRLRTFSVPLSSCSTILAGLHVAAGHEAAFIKSILQFYPF